MDDVRSPKASERVAHSIVRDIIEKGLEPGDRLPPESAMIGEQGVARGTVREALRILEVQGILHLRPGMQGGPVVSDRSTRALARTVSLHLQLDGVTLDSVCRARVAMEPLLAELAAQQPAEATEPIMEAIERSKTYDLEVDRLYLRASSEFHAAVANSVGNPVLSLQASVLRDLFSSRVTYGVIPIGQRSLVIETHERIAQAIMLGKSATARELMHEDMSDWYTSIQAVASGLLAEPIDWH